MNRSDDSESDWSTASYICSSSVRQRLFWANQFLIRFEKRVIEPAANWVNNADLFNIIERISPAIEALGVIAIPFVLFFAGQQYQRKLQIRETHRLQQQAIKDYLNQLSTVLLDVEGDFRAPQNRRLRTLTTATTLTLLDEPNLSRWRKRQIIIFLSEMSLINNEFVYGPQHPDDKEPILSLSGVNLDNVYLLREDLKYADLSRAYLRNINLRWANLSGADLTGSTLDNADLRAADLSGATLNNVSIKHANFENANLNNAEISVVFGYSTYNPFSYYWNSYQTSGSSLDKQLGKALLCNTKLPDKVNLDPDRDCEKLREVEELKYLWSS